MSAAGGAATIKVGYFTMGPVTQMAQKHGFFADENLTVIEIKTSGSTLLFKNLRDGVWDIGLNVADNVDRNFKHLLDMPPLYRASNPLVNRA